jgi:hypothetical protein
MTLACVATIETEWEMTRPYRFGEYDTTTGGNFLQERAVVQHFL